ncbi:hypothetical protein ACO0SA_001321 [Hanseniaspora valbyensis]
MDKDLEDLNNDKYQPLSRKPTLTSINSVSPTANDVYSCKNCQRKKVACSKEMPCSYCAKRNLECVYEIQKSQMVFGIDREREIILKGCDRCLQIMVNNQRWSCDLMSPCYDCMKLGLDCNYSTYNKHNNINTGNGVSDHNNSKPGILKKYILEEFINSDNEKDIEYLEMLQENEMFVESRNENNDDIEVLQLFQDYSYWIMKKGFYNGIVVSNKGFVLDMNKYNGEIFDLNDFLTISVLTAYAIENLGFMFLGIFYDPIKSIAERPESFIKSAREGNKIITVDILLDECVLRTIAVLSIYYMDCDTFYQLTEVTSSKKDLFYKAHLDHLIDVLTRVSHFEDIRIIQVLLILSSTDFPIRYPKKYNSLMTSGFDLIKTLNLNKTSNIINDATLLKFTFIQKNIYYKFLYFASLYQNQLSENQLALLSEKHAYHFRRMHISAQDEEGENDIAEDNDYDEDTRLSFEHLQYKVGLFLKEFHDKEMIVYPRGLLRYYSNLKSKLKYFKKKNVNQLIEIINQDNNSISAIGETIIVNIDYYFLQWKMIKYKFTNSEKTSLKNTMILIDELLSACELIIESLFDCLSDESVKYRFYKYPSIMNCIAETVSFHALYKIFNKSERNMKIFEKLVTIIQRFMEFELMEKERDNNDDENFISEDEDDFKFNNNPYLSKYVMLTRLLDRLNSIKSLFNKSEMNNKDITQNLPFLILQEDVISIKSNFEDRVCNIIPGMSTTIRNDLHSYSKKWDSQNKIDIITNYRENLYVILASFKDFI